MYPTETTIERVVRMALEEDIGHGDVTSTITIPEDTVTEATLVARESLVVCGLPIVARMFTTLDASLEVIQVSAEGEFVEPGTKLMRVIGSARPILAAERSALNLLQHLCGVATLTRYFVEAIKDTKTRVLDTRKTLPGLRELQKYAVSTGGGKNHRMCLDDGILIKDNHIALCGNIKEAVRRAKEKAPALLRIEVECENLKQVKEALEAGVDIILLDNMDNTTLHKAVELVGGKVPVEASGGITLETVQGVAHTGVDLISAGSITHSARGMDISLEMEG